MLHVVAPSVAMSEYLLAHSVGFSRRRITFQKCLDWTLPLVVKTARELMQLRQSWHARAKQRCSVACVAPARADDRAATGRAGHGSPARRDEQIGSKYAQPCFGGFAGRSELKMSAITFHFPAVSFFQTVTYFPLSEIGLPSGPFMEC